MCPPLTLIPTDTKAPILVCLYVTTEKQVKVMVYIANMKMITGFCTNISETSVDFYEIQSAKFQKTFAILTKER
jgi:hypothetical protein